MGKRVREFIEEVGGTMPEELSAPAESIQELEKNEKKRIKRVSQASMFGEE